MVFSKKKKKKKLGKEGQGEKKQGFSSLPNPSNSWKREQKRANKENRQTKKNEEKTKNSTIALCFTIAAHLVQTPLSWELRICFLSGKSPWVVNMGGVVKTLQRRNSLFFYRHGILVRKYPLGYLAGNHLSQNPKDHSVLLRGSNP